MPFLQYVNSASEKWIIKYTIFSTHNVVGTITESDYENIMKIASKFQSDDNLSYQNIVIPHAIVNS